MVYLVRNAPPAILDLQLDHSVAFVSHVNVMVIQIGVIQSVVCALIAITILWEIIVKCVRKDIMGMLDWAHLMIASFALVLYLYRLTSE